MIQSIFHTTENNNMYIYDNQSRLSILVHPELEKVHEKSTKTQSYYLKKYEYLKKHGFFENSKLVEFRTLEEFMVRENIRNVKQVVFETTDSCNLNCTYCALGELYEGVDERVHKKINTHYAINLLKYIFDHSTKNKNHKLYISFYGGEATLNMNFIKRIVKVTHQLNIEKGMELEYSMTTNATLLHKYIDFLYENKFRLLISLDGNEDNHSYRVFSKNKKNSFQKVIENIDIIQKDYPEYFSKYINFNAVLHNRSSVKEIYEFIYTRYNKIPRIAELNTRDISPDKKDVLEKMFCSKRKSEVEYQKEDADLSRITHNELSLHKELTDFLKFTSVNYYISNINALLNTVEKYLPTSTCTPFSKKIFLTTRNKLLPCEKVNYKYSIGKVNDNVEIDISEITRQYNFYYEHLKKFCQSCYAHRFCGACLFQIDNIDNVDKEGFVCDNYHNQKAFKNKLNRIFSFLEKYPSDYSQILENTIIE
jgi:Arylsulfatase regulator (Fe-S oxidoreductase)